MKLRLPFFSSVTIIIIPNLRHLVTPPADAGVYPFFGLSRQGCLPFAVSGTKKRSSFPLIFGIIPTANNNQPKRS
ncbi:MAG: hypothetical protein J6P13_03905, partial [Kiritimatiellae bacterium]|nr:hypothetical protein [Kiritimatiellia bacterium]